MIPTPAYESGEQVCQILREDLFPEKDFLTHIWSFEEVPEAYQQVKQGNVVKGLVVINKESN